MMNHFRRSLCVVLAVFFVTLQVVFPVAAETVKDTVITEMNPYVIKADVRAYMTEEDIRLYKTLVDAVFARAEIVHLSDDYDANLRAFGALQGNPYYFFLEKLTFTKDHGSARLTYAYTPQEQEEMREYIDSQYIDLLNEIIDPGMSELAKTLAVYRYFASRIEYDYDWLDGRNLSDDMFLYPEIGIYQALKTGRGVCHSYTYLCEFALQQLGIECLRFIGEMVDSEDEHMWLVIRIDDAYYHCDPTWDNGDLLVGLNYFGMTDQERRDSGVVNFEQSYDGAYGKIVCDGNRFAIFRGVVNFTFVEGDSRKILLDYGAETVEFDVSERESAGAKK